MGIQGLLPFLDKATRPVNISEFSGYTVAVDSYCWLHKGAFSCAEKLARGEDTDQYVHYCMKYVNLLLSHNVNPILVFDGRHLPAKAETEKKRRENREMNRKRAAELLRLERDTEAKSLIRRCVDVTHEMALKVMKAARAVGVDTIVAPYEADAQLAYFSIRGIAHVVITEDSDLMLFGCKLVLFKMDLNGNGLLVEQDKIPLAMKVHPSQFSLDKFRYMCILSGCDYLPSLPGIGLAKAAKFIKRTADTNISRALTRLGAHLSMPSLVVSADYREKFLQADAMFKYQPVFDPRSRKIVPLNPLPATESNPLPDSLPPEVSFQLALGNLNPFTLNKVDDWDPDQPQKIKTSGWNSTVHWRKSIWASDYVVPNPLPPKTDPREILRALPTSKIVSKNVTSITNKIKALPHHKDVQSEIEIFRQKYEKSPPVKKPCFGAEKDTVHSLNETVMPEDFIDDFGFSPTKKAEDEFMTIKDILEGSPISKSKMRKNPFRCSKLSQNESYSKSESALTRISSVRQSNLESPCIVQSRYFSSTVGNEEETDSRLKIDCDKIFNEASKTLNSSNKQESTNCKKGLSDKKNCFSLSLENVGKIDKLPNPVGPSFLNLIDSLSKKSEKKPDSLKRKTSSNFKWSQPMLNVFSNKVKSPLTDARLIKENVDLENKSSDAGSAQRTNTLESDNQKSPTDGIKHQSLRGKVTTPPGRRRKSTGPGQPSIFEMFAFQPKSKLKA